MASLNSHNLTGLDDVTTKDSFLKNPDLMAKTLSHLQVKKSRRCLLNVALTCKDFLDIALDALWEELDSLVPLLKLLPALQVEDQTYVLSGKVTHADRDTLQYYSQKVKVFCASAIDTDDRQIHPSTYIRIAQLQPSALFPSLRHLSLGKRSIPHIFLFLSPLLHSVELNDIKGFENTIVGPFLAALPSGSQMLRRITLRSGNMSADIFKKHFVHFKQLRHLWLSNAVFMTDFVLWEVIGTLPYLAHFSLILNPTLHPVHGPDNSSGQSGGPKYFSALESLIVVGSFFLIQHLLGFIDSPCLLSIVVYPSTHRACNYHGHESEDLFTPSMTIVASKWSHSLKYLAIHRVGPESVDFEDRTALAISKCLMILTELHELQEFHLTDWRMENMDDKVRRLVMSWPKLRILQLPLNLNQAFISLSTLRIIAENCPELHRLQIRVRLDTSTIPPFDAFSKSHRHNLKVLTVGRAHPSDTISHTILEFQIQAAQYSDFIFPNLKSINVQPKDEIWSAIRDLTKLCRDTRRLTISM